MRSLLILFLLLGSLGVRAQRDSSVVAMKPRTEKKEILKAKLNAVLLTVLSGPVAGHRIYLGTSPKVPFIYAITLGGGLGVLPVIDLGLIIFTKDLQKLLNNPNVFLWNRPG